MMEGGLRGSVQIDKDGWITVPKLLWKELFPEHVAAVIMWGADFDYLWATNSVLGVGQRVCPIWGTGITYEQALERVRPYLV